MPIDPNIPLSVQTPQPQDPIQSFGRIEALKGALGQQQVQAAQLEGLNQENAMRAQQMRDLKATNDAYRSSLSIDSDGNASIDTGKLTRAMAGNGVGNQIPGVMKGINEYQKSVADLAKTHAEVAQLQTDALGNVGRTLQQANYDPHLYLTMTQHAIDGKAVDPRAVQGQIQQVQQALLQDPTGTQARAVVKGIADNAVTMSGKAQELINQSKQAQGNADRGTAALQNAGLNQQKYLSGERSRLLGTATDQASWDAGLQTLKKMGDTLEGVPASFSPQAAQTFSGKTAHQLTTEQQAAARDQNTQSYRERLLKQGDQRIDISQQRADDAEDRAGGGTTPNASGVQGRFDAKEVDRARQQLDQIHQQRTAFGAALQTPNGENYLDPKTGKLSTNEMDDQTRSKLQQQYNNLTNQGQRIIQRYGDDKSGGRIRSNELPAAAPSGQTGGQPGQSAPSPSTSSQSQPQKSGSVAPEGTVIKNAQGVQMVKKNGSWQRLN